MKKNDNDTNAPGIGHNLTKIKDDLKVQLSKITEAERERETHQADIQAAREAILALGVPKRALDFMRSMEALDQTQRDAVVFGMQVLSEVMSVPVQTDVETYLKQKEAADAEASKDDDEA